MTTLLEERSQSLRTDLEVLLGAIIKAVPGDGGGRPDTDHLVGLLERALALLPENSANGTNSPSSAEKLTPAVLEQEMQSIREDADLLMGEIDDGEHGDGPEAIELTKSLEHLFDLLPRSGLEEALDAPSVQRRRRSGNGS